MILLFKKKSNLIISKPYQGQPHPAPGSLASVLSAYSGICVNMILPRDLEIAYSLAWRVLSSDLLMSHSQISCRSLAKHCPGERSLTTIPSAPHSGLTTSTMSPSLTLLHSTSKRATDKSVGLVYFLPSPIGIQTSVSGDVVRCSDQKK